MEGSRLLHTIVPTDSSSVVFGANSKFGTGGMESKVSAAMYALSKGVTTVICNGLSHNPISSIMAGKRLGTMFAKTRAKEGPPVEELATKSIYSNSYNVRSMTPIDFSERVRLVTFAA